MKEYIAKTGGRYTYNDDLLNLQELALSMTAIFDGCTNFIISGCLVSDGRITPGYVWINGKVRYFEGCSDPQFPYYVYEKNLYETVTYASDVNKHGRSHYMCVGSKSIPEIPDEVTGVLPAYIEIREDYAPRLIDKFIGRYALLLDTPFARQTVKKDLTLTGYLSVTKDIDSKTALSVTNEASGYCLRNIVQASGNATVGLYHNGLLASHIEITTDGAFNLYKQGVLLAGFDSSGMKTGNITVDISDLGSIRIEGNDIYNYANATEEGAVHVNRCGYKGGNTKYRNFNVYDGRTAVPLLSVVGQHSKVTVSGTFEANRDGRAVILKNPAYSKTEPRLTSTVEWQDKSGERLGYMGYAASDSLDFTLRNETGNMVLHANGWVDVRGELRVGGVNISDTYVKFTDYTYELSRKVDKISGKQLSTEDFTTAYKTKLDSILTGSISTEEDGFVTAGDVAEALQKKLTISSNLADLGDTGKARTNLGVYSKSEADARYFRIGNALSEAISLSAAEVEGKTPEDIIKLKEQRQQAIRDNIDAEKKGTGEGKLAKASNLSDIPDKVRARQNIEVYSVAEIDSMLAGKLGSDAAYSGIPFTIELKNKVDGIKTGIFAGTVVDGVSQSQVEGYVTTSSVVNQLAMKAPKLLNGYSAADKASVAENIAVYSISVADAKFAAISLGLNDLVSYQVKQGKTTVDAKKALRDNIGAAGTTDLDGYLKKDGKLLDLALADENAKKQACNKLGAAYATEYQTKLADTGWLPCGGSNAGTLFARQIGNIVCVQGRINTARRTSNSWGVCATIPNTIDPPKYGCRQTVADFIDDHVYNRGCSFKITASSRNILIHERGMYNVDTELHFTYMT